MALLTTKEEYDKVREAIQALTTLDADGNRRDVVSIGSDGMSTTYNASQLPMLQAREETLAARLTTRNTRKRVTPDFSGGTNQESVPR